MWTSDQIVSLISLAEKGFSSSEIAAALGPGVTRNAVIGKLHRLGIFKPSRGKRTQATVRALKDLARMRAWDKEVPVTTEADDVVGKSIGELGNHHCRWPVGHPKTPSFGYCGVTDPAHISVAAGRPYCRVHQHRAYVKTSKPRL